MNKLYQLLSLYRISANDLIYIFHLKEGVEIAQNAFPYDIDKMIKAKVIKEEEDGLRVTNKGARLLNQAMDLFKDNGVLVTEENIDEFISEYRLLFPVGKRAHKAALKTKFQKFFKNHDYTFDMILKATKKYIKDLQDRDSLTYMKQADYFIEKDGTSMLLNIISELEESPSSAEPVDKTNILRSMYGGN